MNMLLSNVNTIRKKQRETEEKLRISEENTKENEIRLAKTEKLLNVTRNELQARNQVLIEKEIQNDKMNKEIHEIKRQNEDIKSICFQLTREVYVRTQNINSESIGKQLSIYFSQNEKRTQQEAYVDELGWHALKLLC